MMAMTARIAAVDAYPALSIRKPLAAGPMNAATEAPRLKFAKFRADASLSPKLPTA